MEVMSGQIKAWRSVGRARFWSDPPSSLPRRQRQLFHNNLCQLDLHHPKPRRHILHSASPYLLHNFRVDGMFPASSTTDCWHRTSYRPANYTLPSLLISNTSHIQCLQCQWVRTQMSGTRHPNILRLQHRRYIRSTITPWIHIWTHRHITLRQTRILSP